MFKFDVRYTKEIYYDYYKDTLVKSKIKRDIIFSLAFIGIAIYWWVDGSENTAGNTLPIFATIMAVLFPLMNFISLPSIKRQLNGRQDDIDRTHIMVTFEDDKVVYDNLSEPKKEDVKPVEEANEKEETKVEETKTEEVKEEKKEQTTFDLKYENFAYVKEISTSILFYLDRQTIIIIPKTTMIEGSSLDEFKAFILTKLPKRCKFIKAKKEK